MKKILVLSPRFPYPVIGGDRLRIYKICEQLSRKFELTLLSLCESEEELNISVTDKVFSKIECVYLSSTKSKCNVIRAIPSNTPLQIAYYKSATFADKINDLLPQHDAVFAHLIRTGDYVKGIKKKTILEMTDAISLNYKRVTELSGDKSFRKLVYKFEQKRLEKYERKTASEFNLVSFISDVDRKFLYPESPSNVKVYPNGVDTDQLKFKDRKLSGNNKINIVFIGNMYSLQNMDAVKWFAKSILPNLSVHKKIIQFKIIGRIKDADKAYLNSLANVHATGAVDNINEACADGHIGVCPVRLGAGVQNKILEYMALGLPCITSKVGFEGIGATENSEILIADSLAQYREKIQELLGNENLYHNIACKARQYVEEKFSWESMITPLVNDIEKLLD